MFTESEGIVLKQFNIPGGKRMIVLLSEKYGLISAGTSIPEKGKNKSSLALRPFTKGMYELYKNRDVFSINGAQTLKSYYSIGEDVDKYMAASYVLELTERILPEGDIVKGSYKLLSDFLDLISERKNEFLTPIIAYQLKTLVMQGLTLSENSLLLNERNDKINAVKYMETHSMQELKDLSVEESCRDSLEQLIKQYIADNLGIENLKSESFIL